MKRYDIKILNECNREINMIFSTSYLSPLKFIDDIEKEISTLFNGEVEVIFDLFLSNGNTSERYAKVIFDGNKFIKDSFEFINIDKKNIIRTLSSKYYSAKKKELDFSFLNNIQKKMIIKGIAI